MNWYVSSTGNHQGLIVDEADGRNVAVAYDKQDAPLLAAAPALLEACRAALPQLHWANCHGSRCDEAIATIEAAIAAATETN